MNQIKYIFIRRCTDPDSEGRRKAHRSANGLENKKRWLRIFLLLKERREHGYELSANGNVTEQ